MREPRFEGNDRGLVRSDHFNAQKRDPWRVAFATCRNLEDSPSVQLRSARFDFCRRYLKNVEQKRRERRKWKQKDGTERISHGRMTRI